MSSKDQNLSSKNNNLRSCSGKKFGIVVSDWNEKITHTLLKGCRATLLENEVKEDDINVIHVPGTFELPTGAKMLLGSDSYDAVICLGCVIKGETKHDEYINHAVAQGLVNLGVFSGKPIVFGVLTPNDMEQALDRAGGKYGNKGVEAAQTAMQMALLKDNLKSQKSKIGF